MYSSPNFISFTYVFHLKDCSKRDASIARAMSLSNRLKLSFFKLRLNGNEKLSHHINIKNDPFKLRNI